MEKKKLDTVGNVMKYSLFIVNFLIFILGTLVCSFGIWTLLDGGNVEKITGHKYIVTAASFLVALGAAVAIISFLGCCGAIKEVKCLLGLYFCCMLVFAIIILVAIILGFVNGNKLNENTENVIKETMKEYGTSGAEPLTSAWDTTQKQLECCGANNYADWEKFKKRKFDSGNPFPESCCKPEFENCQKLAVLKSGSFFERGCVEAFREFLKKHANPLKIVGITIFFIIVFALVFSIALCLII